MQNEDEVMTVSEVAREMNVATDTVRWYDREGLLKPIVVTRSGRRLYKLSAVHELMTIRASSPTGRLPYRSKQPAETQPA